jgi:hypothetical protein
MIWSLLQRFDLRKFPQYNWDKCDWSKVNDRTGPGLRDDLQRLQFPKDIAQPTEYAGLYIEEVLVRFTHRLVTACPVPKTFTTLEPHQQANNSSAHLLEAQELTYVNVPDMCFPVPPSYTQGHPNVPPIIGLEVATQKLPFEVFPDARPRQNCRPDSEAIPQTACLHYESDPIAITTVGDRNRNISNAQPDLATNKGQECIALESIADALHILCRRQSSTKAANPKARHEPQLLVLLEGSASSDTSETVIGQYHGEFQSDTTQLTHPMSGIEQWVPCSSYSPESES